jgi:hypothetical protein
METYTLPVWLRREFFGIIGDEIRDVGNSMPLPAVFRSGRVFGIKVGSKGIEVILPGRPSMQQLEGLPVFAAVLGDDVRRRLGVQTTLDWEERVKSMDVVEINVAFGRLFARNRNGVVMMPFAFLGQDP